MHLPSGGRLRRHCCGFRALVSLMFALSQLTYQSMPPPYKKMFYFGEFKSCVKVDIVV